VTTVTSVERRAAAVAIPTEHGGWGLTLEPVLLGLIVAWSGAGAALGVAAFRALLLRTPAKLIAVDPAPSLGGPFTLARRMAIGELVVLVAAVLVAAATAGWTWVGPVAMAAPLVAVTAVGVLW
jgi:hypothetical protein